MRICSARPTSVTSSLFGPSISVRLYGALLGTLALAAGLAVAEVVAGLIAGAPTPVVAVGQTVIDLVPPALKDWAIATFGTANKMVLVTMTLVVLAVLGVATGAWALGGKRRAALGTVAVVGAFGLLSVVSRPTTSAALDLLPTLLAVVVAASVLVVVPAVARPRPVGGGAEASGEHEAPRAAAAPMGVDRRRFLGASAILGAGSVAGGGLGRLLQRRYEVEGERAALELPDVGDRIVRPADVEIGVEGLTRFETPATDFFRIDTALVVPQVSIEDWRLRIHGLVDRELVIGFDDLLARPQVERDITIACVSNEVGGNLIGNARWQGVLLADLLREAGIDPAAEQLVSRSVDGWTCGTPVEAVLDGRDALLAIGMNGAPLPDRHGYPVRMIVPGLFGYVSATKWLAEIEVTTWDAYDAYWVVRGWAEQAPVKTMTRIDRPRHGSRWRAGPLDIGGVAWAVHRGISAVEVRIDDGPWQRCELAGVPSADTWRQWHLRWDAPPGEHVVEARAVDGAGVPQPSEPRPPAPDGAQGYHRAVITVT